MPLGLEAHTDTHTQSNFKKPMWQGGTYLVWKLNKDILVNGEVSYLLIIANTTAASNLILLKSLMPSLARV